MLLFCLNEQPDPTQPEIYPYNNYTTETKKEKNYGNHLVNKHVSYKQDK